MSVIKNEDVVRFLEEHPGLQFVFSTNDHIYVETFTGTQFEYDVYDLDAEHPKRQCADCEGWFEYLTENNHCQICVKYP